MNKITLQVVLGSVRARKDGSLGLTIETPELSPEEKVKVMELQNSTLQAVFIPLDTPDVPDYVVNKEMETKTPSQRLRAALYVMHQQSNSKDDFEVFYKQKMEKFIDAVKEKLQ